MCLRQRPTLALPLLPGSSPCPFRASLSQRSVLQRSLLAATSAPHGKGGSCLAAARCSTGLSLLRSCLSPQTPPRSAPPISSPLTTLAPFPQHPRRRRLPPPKPPFVHPMKSVPIRQFAFSIWLFLPILHFSFFIISFFILSYLFRLTPV